MSSERRRRKHKRLEKRTERYNETQQAAKEAGLEFRERRFRIMPIGERKLRGFLIFVSIVTIIGFVVWMFTKKPSDEVLMLMAVLIMIVVPGLVGILVWRIQYSQRYWVDGGDWYKIWKDTNLLIGAMKRLGEFRAENEELLRKIEQLVEFSRRYAEILEKEVELHFTPEEYYVEYGPIHCDIEERGYEMILAYLITDFMDKDWYSEMGKKLRRALVETFLKECLQPEE